MTRHAAIGETTVCGLPYLDIPFSERPPTTWVLSSRAAREKNWDDVDCDACRSGLGLAASKKRLSLEEKLEVETRPPRSVAERFAAEAMMTLAGLDPDHAEFKNDRGFDSAHCSAGHALAQSLQESGNLTEDGWRLAKILARKFHRQVGEMPTEQDDQ